MAIVILGGLLTSMALNLLVLPTLALRFGRFGPVLVGRRNLRDRATSAMIRAMRIAPTMPEVLSEEGEGGAGDARIASRDSKP
jgi:hypothetical protein